MSKRILLVNSVLGMGSTGKIVGEYAEHFLRKGFEVKAAYGRGKVEKKYSKIAIRIGSKLNPAIHALRSRIFDDAGWGSKKATRRFIEWAESFDPDIIWLHNLHGYYLNLPILFDWLKTKPQLKIVITLHDCWLFTGHCSHFTYSQCRQWTNGCTKCPRNYQFHHMYPKTYFIPRCKRNYSRKKALFEGLNNVQIVTPSEWLEMEVQKSFLSSFPIRAIPNQINHKVFYPSQSDVRTQLELDGKIVVLAIANVWTRNKGFEDLISVAKKLDSRFSLVIVGLKSKDIRVLKERVSNRVYSILRKKGYEEIVFSGCSAEGKKTYRSKVIPESPDAMVNALEATDVNNSGVSNILCFGPIRDQNQLAELYSSADVFINCTHEDNYPTVNLEAVSCGCPVITYDVGGCRETIREQQSEEEFWKQIDSMID